MIDSTDSSPEETTTGELAASPIDPTVSPAAGPPPAERTRPRGFRRAVRFILKELVLPLGLAVVLALVIQATVARPYVIPTESMNPTIKPSERVLANRFVYHLRDVHRGDIVVFTPPASLDSPVPFVKRVIGLPGDRVEIVDGRVLINGKPLDEPYPLNPATYSSGPVTVPPGQYYVLGDSRNNSSDSHAWGTVPASKIIGQAWITYWPPQRIGLVPTYTYAATP